MTIFNETELIHLLQEYNPWWEQRRCTLEMPEMQRRAYHDALSILDEPGIRRFVVLSGARRVGKTTVMRQMIAELLSRGVNPDNILYLSFDNPVLKLTGIKPVIDAYDRARPREGTRYFFLDEIQYAEDWSLWLKVLYDQRPELQLVATGSASPYIEKGARDSGVGRWRVLRMPTLNFYEYCELMRVKPELPAEVSPEELARMNPAELAGLMRRFAGMAPHWNRYLNIGGFPELLHLDNTFRAQSILREDVVDKVLKRDIPSLFDVRNTLQLEKVFLYLCLHSGSLINAAAMCRQLEGVSQPTLSRYMEFLQDANLIYICHSIDYSGKKGLSSQPKIYVADVALRNATLMRNPERLSDEERGLMAETTVYRHFRNAYTSPCRVGYLRREQREVDVAVDFPAGERLLCEVKYKNDSSLTADDAIMALCREKAAAAAFLATRNMEDFGISCPAEGALPLIRIPAAVLCYLLGAVNASSYAG